MQHSRVERLQNLDHDSAHGHEKLAPNPYDTSVGRIFLFHKVSWYKEANCHSCVATSCDCPQVTHNTNVEDGDGRVATSAPSSGQLGSVFTPKKGHNRSIDTTLLPLQQSAWEHQR